LQNQEEQGQVRPEVVTDLANALVKKIDIQSRKLRKNEEPLNMSEIAAAFVAVAHQIDTQRGGCVIPVMGQMLAFAAQNGSEEPKN
jgi:hypothetical protein